MFFQQEKPRAGVAEILSGDEGLSVTTRKPTAWRFRVHVREAQPGGAGRAGVTTGVLPFL